MPLVYIFCTWFLPGFAAAVWWRALLGDRASRTDAVLWIAASPYCMAALYYCALGVWPHQPSSVYRLLLPGLLTIAAACRPRAAASVCRDLVEVFQSAVNTLRRFRMVQLLCLVALLAAYSVLLVRVYSMATMWGLYANDALDYTSRGWDWHVMHSLAYWDPTQPDPKGWFQAATHGPGYELLLAWTAEWVPNKVQDLPFRLPSILSHVAGLAVICIAARKAGPWAPWLAGGMYLGLADLAIRVHRHNRDPFRVLGFLLLVVALERCWRLPFIPRVVILALAGAAAMSGHSVNLIAGALLGLAWCFAYRSRWRLMLPTFAVALPLAMMLGGKHYVRQLQSFGEYGTVGAVPRPVEHTEATAQRWSRIENPPLLPSPGLQDVGTKAGLLVRRNTVEPHVVLAGIACLAVIGGAMTGARRRRLPPKMVLYGAVVVAHVFLALGFADLAGPRLSVLFSKGWRYMFHVHICAVLCVVWAVTALKRQSWPRRSLGTIAICALAIAPLQLWSQTSFERTYVRFPQLLPDSRAPKAHALALTDMATMIQDDLVLLVMQPAMRYYTDVRGFTWLDPRMATVYMAPTPREQHQALWDHGVRYVMCHDYFGSRWLWDTFDALGITDLVSDPNLSEAVGGYSEMYLLTSKLYRLLPPKAAEENGAE